MAKSIRSKWKRKMRAVKREKNRGREMERLNRITGKPIDDLQANTSNIDDMEGVTIVDASTVVAAKGKKKKSDKRKSDVAIIESDENVDQMEVEASVDGETKKRLNPKTLKDEHGRYPVWMHQRKVKKMQATAKKLKKRKNNGRK